MDEGRKVNQPSLRPNLYGKCINLKIAPKRRGNSIWDSVGEYWYAAIFLAAILEGCKK
jgi:hypothetical protein